MKNILLVVATVVACVMIFIAGAVYGASSVEIDFEVIRDDVQCFGNCLGA